MRYLLINLLIISCAQKKFTKRIDWSVTKDIINPESVYFDTEYNSIYISNINGDGDRKDGNGHISLYSGDGKVINTQWVTDLNAPKGMRSYKGLLWVADINKVIVINKKTGKIDKSFIIPGAKFLNDIAIDRDGAVYISDTITSKVHKIQNNKSTTFLVGEKYDSPNGLLVLGNKLYIASWGLTKDWSTKTPGRLYSIDLKTKEMKYITKNPLGNLDGLELRANGKFLVSDWVAGKVFEVDMKGNAKLIFSGKQGLADIGYDKKTDRIFIPYMKDNKVFSL